MLALMLRIAGAGLLLLALLHVFFPRRFGWRNDLTHVSLLNRQLFYVHTVFIAVTVAFFGVLSFLAADALATPSPLLTWMLGGFALFWLVRLAIQLFGFDPALWKGRSFETAMHVLFTILWVGLTALYAWAWWVVAR